MSSLARSAFTAGESALVPFGSVTTGTSGIVSPPVPRYCCAIVWFVSQPSLLGTENSGSSASVAGPAATTPAMVRKIQPRTTVRLCARTQRVSEDTVYYLRRVCLRAMIITGGNGLYQEWVSGVIFP